MRVSFIRSSVGVPSGVLVPSLAPFLGIYGRVATTDNTPVATANVGVFIDNKRRVYARIAEGVTARATLVSRAGPCTCRSYLADSTYARRFFVFGHRICQQRELIVRKIVITLFFFFC